MRSESGKAALLDAAQSGATVRPSGLESGLPRQHVRGSEEIEPVYCGLRCGPRHHRDAPSQTADLGVGASLVRASTHKDRIADVEREKALVDDPREGVWMPARNSGADPDVRSTSRWYDSAASRSSRVCPVGAVMTTKPCSPSSTMRAKARWTANLLRGNVPLRVTNPARSYPRLDTRSLASAPA
jgi:hypothetical protein